MHVNNLYEAKIYMGRHTKKLENEKSVMTPESKRSDPLVGAPHLPLNSVTVFF